MHFAWDLPSNEARTRDVTTAIRRLFAVGFRPHDLRVYVLVGFPGYELQEELHRIETLHRLGVEPYVMVYRDYGQADTRRPAAHGPSAWNNGHTWRSVAWADYRRALAS